MSNLLLSPLQTKECPRCHDKGMHTMTLRNDTHYADVRCQKCGNFLGFVPKPDSDATKYKRPKEHTDLVKKFSKGYCELCYFGKDQLPRGETLHAHHVDRYSEGGEATRENVWILCTACHRLVEYQRTYRSKFLHTPLMLTPQEYEYEWERIKKDDPVEYERRMKRREEILAEEQAKLDLPPPNPTNDP